MLVYKSEIWPKNHLPHTKSDCIGFEITSGIPVVSYVSYRVEESENTDSDAVSGNADIFSIKVDSRLKTIFIHTGVATEMNFSSVFLQKYTCVPKYRFWECSERGMHKMPDQPKPPLKVGQSG